MLATPNTPYEELKIDINSLETSANHLICLIKPAWVSKTLTFKKLSTDDSSLYYSVFPSDFEDERHGIVIKLYPIDSDLYADHKKEYRLIEQLVDRELVPRILLTFANGYFSSYIIGKTLDIHDDHTHPLIAERLAKFHSLPLQSSDCQHFVDRLKTFIDLLTKTNNSLQNRLSEIQQNPPVESESFLSKIKSAIGVSSAATPLLTIDQLELQLKDTSWGQISTEIDFMRSIFQDTWPKYNLPSVLCLNNTNTHNFLYDTKNKNMSIIDFDHCSYNYFLIDIVSYFLELAKEDYQTKYPPRLVQKSFLKEYLKHTSLNLSVLIDDPLKPIDNELERLCDLCGLLIAPVHLYWALWAFLQGLIRRPTSTFDYINYAKIRLAQYQRHKDKFFLPLYKSRTNFHKQ